ncbi:MAG: type IX secretion system membrane protein PorP/SprF [Cyclobacteriaceae bacterium]|nr:type IX secretion system membrane protein PorP/SprF [Cyclobacteriaceae bacterium]
MKQFLTILFALASLTVLAQQDPLYSHYLNNPLLLNPAYSGSTTDFSASVMYRKQWAGFEGSPVTMNASGHTALSNNRMGLGLLVLQDRVGADKTTEATLAYSYHVPLSPDLKLSFGLQGGFINYQTDYSQVNFNPADGKFSNVSEWKPNLGTGLLLRGDKFMLGLSVPKLLKATTTVEDLSTSLYNQHAYALAGYVFQLSYRIKVKPWVLGRVVGGAPVSLDYGTAIKVDDSYTLGLFTRNFSTYGALAQINLGDNLRFGYVFELPTGKSVGVQFTTHEVTLGVRLGLLNFHDLTTIRNF